jgi:hypothetical protein
MKYLKNTRVILLILAAVMLMGCSGLKTNWDSLPESDQAKIVLGTLQKSLNMWFDAGASFVVTHPEYADKWKNEILPGFDLANTAIKDAAVYQKSPASIYSEVSPTITKITEALSAWGVTIDQTTTK